MPLLEFSNRTLSRVTLCLHAVLVVLHLSLVGCAIHRTEHSIHYSVTARGNAPVVALSASLQAFYTFYTALLVYFTQRLFMLLEMNKSQNLTVLHDAAKAWHGIGAALDSLWQQRKVAAAPLKICGILLYLLCISALQVCSPSIMQFQLFNSTMTATLPTTTTWPSPTMNWNTIDWVTVTSLVPSVGRLPGLSSPGLINSTLYNVVTSNVSPGNATVDAVDLVVSCLPLSDSIVNTGRYGEPRVNYSNGAPLEIDFVPWKDQIVWRDDLLDPSGSKNYLTLLVSSDLEGNHSLIDDAAVQVMWINNQNVTFTRAQQDLDLYLVYCDLSLVEKQAVVDAQSNELLQILDHTSPSASQRSALLSDLIINGTQKPSNVTWIRLPFEASVWTNDKHTWTMCTAFNGSYPCAYGRSAVESFLMELVGMTPEQIDPLTFTNTTPTFALSLDKLETSLSKILATLVWTAGKLGEETGGFNRVSGWSQVQQPMEEMRLNINWISLIPALSASVVAFALTTWMISIDKAQSGSNQQDPGVLQLIWLSAHKKALSSYSRITDEPTEDELRTKGMFKICLARSHIDDADAPDHNCGVAIANSDLSREESTQLAWQGYSPIPLQREDSEISSPEDGIKTSSSTLIHRACFCLHALLAALHVSLVAIATHHLEHRAVFPITQKSDLLSVTLSVALQAFYTAYTALLLYLTQRLSTSRVLRHKETLTSLHDLTRAWCGIGSAIDSLWQQKSVASSPCKVTAIMVYLMSIGAIHISASSIMQFENFNNMIGTSVPTAVGWPSPFVNLSSMDWATITSLAPFVHEFAGWSTAGLANGTLYDILLDQSGSGNASVGATTINLSCALVTDMFYNASSGDLETLSSNATGSRLPISELPWKDQVVSNLDLFFDFLTTTKLEGESSAIQEAAIPFNWSFYTDAQSTTVLSQAELTMYLVSCDIFLDQQTVQIDAQSNELLKQVPSGASSTGQWPTLSRSEEHVSSQMLPNITWIRAPFDLALWSSMSQVRTTCLTPGMTIPCYYTLSTSERFLMQLLGMAESQIDPTSFNDTTPTMSISVDQMESALSRLLATMIWTAGQLRGAGSGFDPTAGTATVEKAIVQMRLNISWIPLCFALGSSMMLFMVAIYMTGLKSDGHATSLIQTLGVLQIIWLASSSSGVSQNIGSVQEPTIELLRYEGQYYVCIAEEGHRVSEK